MTGDLERGPIGGRRRHDRHVAVADHVPDGERGARPGPPQDRRAEGPRRDVGDDDAFLGWVGFPALEGGPENFRSRRVLAAVGFALVGRRRVYGAEDRLKYEVLSVGASGE